MLTRIGAGRLSDQLGNRLRPLRWIGLASAAGLLATALLAQSRLSLVVTVIVVAGAVSMAWNGLSLTVAAELAGRARSGAAIGFQQTTLGVIGVLVPCSSRISSRPRRGGRRSRSRPSGRWPAG